MIFATLRTSIASLLVFGIASVSSGEPLVRSAAIRDLLRQPLPAELLRVEEAQTSIEIIGPTFRYAVDRASGMISEIEVRRDGAVVLASTAPLAISIDEYRFAPGAIDVATTILSAEPAKVVLQTTGELQGAAPIPVVLQTTFYSDGVVVTQVTLTPAADLVVRDRIEYVAQLRGELDRYLHKCQERWDGDSGGAMPPLPSPGETVEITTTTSCLQTLSHRAGAAIFTDMGAYHVSPAGATTASVAQGPAGKEGQAQVTLRQRIATVGAGGEPLRLPAGEPFTFRCGVSVAPNRHAHPRSSELRHFTWVGDDRHPYPTEDEIKQVAQLGFNVFQTHRLGLLGQPRPPRGELERVIRQVHEQGMLFILLTLPDLLDAHSPRLQQMQANGSWRLWEGTAYGGRYTAPMDGYVDYYATCVGAPNGLADYHLETATQMLDRFDVDGIYLDDNITRSECPDWRAHGHPRPVYDCLIELHEVNWRRRRLLLERAPHALLIDHCNIGLWLPLLSSFDAHLYGEGHNISTLEGYWNFYSVIKAMNAQGNLWPGGMDGARFATPGAYVLDLLTGGGQYMYIDWRLFRNKFSYAAGVLDNEAELVERYNLAQHYFGMHESQPVLFEEAASALAGEHETTAVAVYRNQTWDDSLIVVGNTSAESTTDSLRLLQPQILGVKEDVEYGVFDVGERRYGRAAGRKLDRLFSDVELPGNGLQLYYVRATVSGRPQHIWGGKRLEEQWRPAERQLRVRLSGPTEVTETVYLDLGGNEVGAVTVNGMPADFSIGSDGQLLHGDVTFQQQPLLLEVQLGAGHGMKVADPAPSGGGTDGS